MRKSVFIFPLFILTLFFFTACSGGGGGSAGTPPVSTPGIGPNGGTVTSADGKASVEIPAGALSKEVAISVEIIASPGPGHLGPTYQFGPEGTTFNTPVKINITYVPPDIPAEINENNLRLGKFNNLSWQIVPASSGDATLGKVVGETNNFSIYSIVPNTPPVANAGEGQTVSLGEQVLLNGADSSDADGDSLTFKWSFISVPAGSNALFSDTTTVNPSFIVDLPGSYVAQLVVDDGFENSAVSTVSITTTNSAPVAEAGPGQTALIGETVHLDVSGSTDVDGDRLTYLWSMRSAPIGSAASLSDPSALSPNFMIDQAGAYVVELSVSDGAASSLPDTVDISTLNTLPVADAGPDQKVGLSEMVSLDGSASGDADGNVLSFTWSFVSVPASSAASLSVSTVTNPTFQVDEPGSYVLQLVVNDGAASSFPDTVEVSTSATRPVADAGIDQSIIAQDVVNLSGIDSSDADGDMLSYRWSLLNVPGGSLAAIDLPTALNPVFTADLSGTYIAQLIVRDGSLNSRPDTVVISSGNVRPIANAGLDQSVNAGDLVQLIGTVSHDANLDVLNYRWAISQKPAGSGVVLSDVSLGNPTFTPDLVGVYLLQLIVDDGLLDSLPDTVGMTVEAPQPVITDFSPKSASSGELITLTGANLKGPSGLSKVTLRKQNGGNISAPLGSRTPTTLTFTIPPGAETGIISIDVAGQSASSASVLTIVPSNDFSLKVAPAAAELIQGESVAYTITLNSLNGFTQLSVLGITGLPAGVTAVFKPAQITAGQTSLLTLSAPVAQPEFLSALTVTASATVDGIPLSQSGTLSVTVVAITTSFRGQAVIADALQTPLAGVTVTLLGLDDAGNPTGCTGSTVSDAAGNFSFTNLTTACIGKQLIRYDGLTATGTGEYAGVDLVYNIQDGKVTESPILIHLPRIDNAETVMVQQNASADQTVTFSTIPNLKVLVYAGTTLSLADGSQPNPFPLIAIQVPIDRLPDEMPLSNTVAPFIVAFQPANATASQPIPVTFPNLLNTPAGTVVSLSTLDPTKGSMVTYGTGTVSSDGTQIVPDFDPVTLGKKRFGLVHFDWHGPVVAGPPVNPTPGSCPIPEVGQPIDLSSGVEIIRSTDMAISGSRGSIAIRRVYRTLSTEAGPFGLGTNHNYSYRLDTRNPDTAAIVNLIMPDGNRFALSRQDDIPVFIVSTSGGRRSTLRINLSVPKLAGAVLETFPDGKADFHWKDGTIFHFEPSTFALGSVLSGITDANGNTTTLVRNASRPAQITEIIDPVGRKLLLTYDAGDRILSITDPINRTVTYTYTLLGTLETVTDPEGGVTRHEYDDQNRLLQTTDPRGVVISRNTFDANGRVIEQVQGDNGVLKFDYQLMNPGVPTSPVQMTTFTDAMGNETIYRFNPQGFLVSATDALGQMRVLEREAGTNRLLAITGTATCNVCGISGSGDQRFTYDQAGNRISSTDALGNVTSFAYTSVRNRLISTTDPLGHETQLTYDNAGNLLSVTDAKGNAASIAYDIFGLPTSTTDPLGVQSFVEYDGYANPVRATDALGQTTTSQFDAVSRPVILINALGQRSERIFDKLNRVTNATDAQGRTTQSSYDEVGNLLSLTDARGHVTTFTYDTMNRLLTKTDPLGKIDSRTYDLNGNLIKFVDRRAQLSSFTYDALNRLIREDYHDGSVVTREYDASSRLIRVNDSAGGVFSFAYDLVGRLIREVGPFGTVSYRYDKRGNMIERQVLGQPFVQYLYDAVGNLLSTATPEVGVDFTYDARNQMIRQGRTNGVATDFIGHRPLVKTMHFSARL